MPVVIDCILNIYHGAKAFMSRLLRVYSAEQRGSGVKSPKSWLLSKKL